MSGHRSIIALGAAAVLAAFAIAQLPAPLERLEGDAARAREEGSSLAPDAAEWIDAGALHESGFGRVLFEARDGNILTALVYRGTRFDPASGPIWFVMHGQSRAAEHYVETAAPVAERHDALAIVIHFPRELYRNGSDYTLGVTTHGPADERAWAEGRWRSPEDYLYMEVERLFEAARRTLGGRQSGYYLFGHSAGAQFTHRLMTFVPGARALRAVAANAGWYTLPVDGAGPDRTMPYGLHGSPLEPRDLRRFFASSFVVLLGERDTSAPDDDDLVRGTAEAMAQGANRLERGRFYFETSREQARELETPFGWRLAVVPRAGHAARQMIASAGYFLFARDEPPCTPTPAREARGLVITEILADPPRGDRGDANGDGLRDPSDDEFVEIVNAGRTPVCLTGWTLADGTDAERHVFPLGEALEPGEAVVVFGGGVPTGDFGGARVETAAFGRRLSLSNDGDVLTLRDGEDEIVRQLSWGDCAAEACASDHWPDALDVSGALVRSPEPAGEWKPHASHGAARFSPGVKADGSRWRSE